MQNLSLFEIKGAHLPLLTILIRTADIDSLEQEFTNRFSGQDDFFDHDPIVIDLSALVALNDGSALQINFSKLISLLKQYRLTPIAIKSGSPMQVTEALTHGLFLLPDIFVKGGASKGQATDKLLTATSLSDQPPAPPQIQRPLSDAISQNETLVITRPIRSGQQIYAQGGDVIVLAIVNVGAEIIADGNIHVYAPLRGRAIAGAKGNIRSRIFASALDAEILSIAGVYSTAEDVYREATRGMPAQVCLQTIDAVDKLVVTPLTL